MTCQVEKTDAPGRCRLKLEVILNPVDRRILQIVIFVSYDPPVVTINAVFDLRLVNSSTAGDPVVDWGRRRGQTRIPPRCRARTLRNGYGWRRERGISIHGRHFPFCAQIADARRTASTVVRVCRRSSRPSTA